MEGNGGESLSISLVGPREVFELGEPILLQLRIENVGASPLFFERPRNLGPHDLRITASSPHCNTDTGFWHFDIATEDLRFLVVPLLSGDAIELGLPSFNDLAGLDTLVLRRPGRYHLQARWRSRGPSSIGGYSVVWRGVVKSEPFTIELLPPSEKRLSYYRERLKGCLEQPICFDLEAIEYFRIVRDPGVAEMLRCLLQRDHETNPRIAEAVANQGGPADIEMLRALADRTSWPESRSYFLDLARHPTSAVPCGNSTEPLVGPVRAEPPPVPEG